MAEKKEETKKETPKKETSKKEEKPKQEEKPRAPQKETKKKPVKKAVIQPMAHINDYLSIATEIYGLNDMQKAGFKSFMTGKHYLSDLEAFEPYLNRYLGK